MTSSKNGWIKREGADRHEIDPRKNLQARRSHRHKETGKNHGHGRHAATQMPLPVG
jgi:hypothetical protein